MGFENTNFVDDLGHKVGKEHPILGCLGVILIGGLFFAGVAAISGLYTYYTLSAQAGSPAFKDGKKTITFKPPEKWICFNAKDETGPYAMNKIFVEKKKYYAVLDKVPFKSVKYSKNRMKYSTGEIAKLARAALKAKLYDKAAASKEKIDINGIYYGYARVKCVYKDGYGYAVYKRGKKTLKKGKGYALNLNKGPVMCYYFRAVRNFMIVMEYVYDDSEANREEALQEQVKLEAMWKTAFEIPEK